MNERSKKNNQCYCRYFQRFYIGNLAPNKCDDAIMTFVCWILIKF